MYESYLAVAIDHNCKVIFGSPTWRASADHMSEMGYEKEEVERIN